MSEATPPFLRRVVLRNYKSIRQCDVTLGPLTFLVGPNGSGKSNFLDALRFVAESLQTNMDYALRDRGGLKEVCARMENGTTHFEIEMELALPEGELASYRFRVGANPGSPFAVRAEECRITRGTFTAAQYRVRDGQIEVATVQPRPPVSIDRLYLTNAAGFPEFRRLHDLLSCMTFYNINPDRIREEPNLGGPDRLQRDGQGAVRALRQLWLQSPTVKERIDQYMHALLPVLDRVAIESFDEMTTRIRGPSPTDHFHEYLFLSFVLHIGNEPVFFSARNMSDGTLRAFALLLALFQCVDRPERDPIPLVGIEEPEATLHPAAAGVLFDALHEASHFTQVLVTTHSVELLNIKDLDPDSLLVVDLADGQTVIGPADEVSLSAMKERMYTAGELLEMDQLRPNPRPAQAAGDGTGDGSSTVPPKIA